MTLFEKIKDSVELGNSINFKREINQLLITVEHENNGGTIIKRESCLPLSDHFYEERVVSCIEWMETEISDTDRMLSSISKK